MFRLFAVHTLTLGRAEVVTPIISATKASTRRHMAGWMTQPTDREGTIRFDYLLKPFCAVVCRCGGNPANPHPFVVVTVLKPWRCVEGD